MEETFEGTIIHQRQSELTCGVWNFVVFGPSLDNKKVVMRIGSAEHMMIQQASVYMATVGSPAHVGKSGMMTIEELSNGDVPEEFAGLEVYHVEPLRPFSITEKRNGEDLSNVRDIALEEYSSVNTAIIETPNEKAWAISVLKYLREFDAAFPDPFITSVQSKIRDTSINFSRGPKRLH